MNSKSALVVLREAIAARCQVESQTLTMLLAAFFAGLPVLIEDVPGVGKTTLARTLALACGLDFSRIQCAPDILPGDILGMSIWSIETRTFVYKAGPIMHQVILVDELNRAGTRTQAALLEAMEEGQVSIDGSSHLLPQPFFLIATQNPSGFAGTYQLPEAQLDRFGLLLRLGYPSNEPWVLQSNVEFVNRSAQEPAAVLMQAEIVSARSEVRLVTVTPVLYQYVSKILAASRSNGKISLGLSPRAGIQWLRLAQALAWGQDRRWVLPEDLLGSAELALAHRLIPSAESHLDGTARYSLVKDLLARVPLPNGVV